MLSVLCMDSELCDGEKDHGYAISVGRPIKWHSESMWADAVDVGESGWDWPSLQVLGGPTSRAQGLVSKTVSGPRWRWDIPKANFTPESFLPHRWSWAMKKQKHQIPFHLGPFSDSSWQPKVQCWWRDSSTLSRGHYKENPASLQFHRVILILTFEHANQVVLENI